MGRRGSVPQARAWRDFFLDCALHDRVGRQELRLDRGVGTSSAPPPPAPPPKGGGETLPFFPPVPPLQAQAPARGLPPLREPRAPTPPPAARPPKPPPPHPP